MVNTDEWRSYNPLESLRREHPTVCHGSGDGIGSVASGERELARDDDRDGIRDDDRDGIREVDDNTPPGDRAGLRNFLRPFRGVGKWYRLSSSGRTASRG